MLLDPQCLVGYHYQYTELVNNQVSYANQEIFFFMSPKNIAGWGMKIQVVVRDVSFIATSDTYANRSPAIEFDLRRACMCEWNISSLCSRL